ncbi:MAG: PAS domain S-box protein [Deltaproteobacteria bacterium]|nr:PAS domain S-box protein [Deltaproteobacteria bacterium]
MKKTIWIAASALVAFALYAASLYNYLLFHLLSEVFAIIIACGIFMVAWNCRHYMGNQYLLFLGIAYLFIGSLDLVHTFTYKGMNLMPGYSANAPTQLWIAARYMESLTLLAAPLMFRLRTRAGYMALGYGAVSAGLLLSILYWGIFPDCFVEDAGGLTPFKKISEYVISAILLASAGLLLRFRDRFEPKVLRWLLLSIAFTIVSELSFTTYASVYGFTNLLGHFFKIVSFFLIYKAVIETGLTSPYDLLFRDLHRQREWLRVTLGSIGDAVIATDTSARITFLNAVASTLTGWETGEAMGRPVTDVLRTIDEQSREPAEDVAGRVLKEKRVVKMANHTALLSRDGREIPIEDSAAPIEDRDGHVLGAVIVFHDVTERRLARNSLLRSEKRFRSVVDSNIIGVVFSDPGTGRVTDANDEFLRIAGRSRKELTAGALLWSHIVAPDFQDPEGRPVETHPDDAPGRAVEKEYLRPDGTRVPVIVGSSFLDDTRRQTVSYVLDNTERKRVEEALRRSESTYRAIAHNFPAGGVYVFDRDRRIQVADGQGLALIGFSRETLEGRSWEVLDESLRSRLEKGVEDVLHGRSGEQELEYRGRIRHVHFVPIRDGQGEVMLGMIVAQDVTEQRENQKALARANEELERKVRERTAELEDNYRKLSQANERLNARADQLRMLAGELTMAEQRERKRLSKLLHDGLQQYLAIAKLQVGHIAHKIGDPDLHREAETIEENLGESIQLARSLSAELSPPVLHEGGLSSGLEWLSRWVNENHGFSVALSIEDSPDLPEDVKVLVFEAVRELLFNAVKHAGVSRARVALAGDDTGGIRITVSDEGAGFDPDGLNRSEENLSGLGLFSIRERIELIGGSFEIESEPGKGSCFTLHVPNAVTPAAVPGETRPGLEAAREKEPSEAGAIRVLLADDHALFRDGMARLLAREPDMEVVGHAMNGREAVETARRLRPDVVLMDINMPEVDGIEATEAIHREIPQIRVIGLSMYEDQEWERSMIHAGAVDFKSKGCAASELIAAIRTSVKEEAPDDRRDDDAVPQSAGRS